MKWEKIKQFLNDALDEGKDEKPDYYDIALALIPNRIKHEVSYYRNGKRGDKDYPNENIAYYPEKNKHK